MVDQREYAPVTAGEPADPGSGGAHGAPGPAWDVPGPDRDSVARAIGRLAGPMAMADVLGIVALVAIVALMARMGADALYVRALYVPLVNLFVAVYAGLGFSNQVAAAVSRGRGRPQDVVPLMLSFARVWLVLSAVLIVTVALLAPSLASLLNVAPAHRGQFVAFVRWMAPAELAHAGAVLVASSLRGFGRAAAGSLVSLTTAAAQFGSVIVFGLWLGRGMFAVPASIAGGAALGMVVGAVFLVRAGLWRGARLTAWRPEAVGHLLGVGLPVAVTQLLLCGGNLGLLWVLRGSGQDAVSGFSAAVSFQVLLIMPGIVLGSAVAIVLNQQRAAGKAAWMPTGLRAGIQIGLILYLFITVFVWEGREGFAAGMTGNAHGAAAQASAYLGVVGLTYVVQGPVLAALTSMEQLGAGALAVGLNVLYYVAVIVISHLVVATSGPEGVYRTIAIANLVGVTVVATAFLVVRKMSTARQIDAPQAAGSPQEAPTS